jgi:hypothetical protein
LHDSRAVNLESSGLKFGPGFNCFVSLGSVVQHGDMLTMIVIGIHMPSCSWIWVAYYLYGNLCAFLFAILNSTAVSFPDNIKGCI